MYKLFDLISFYYVPRFLTWTDYVSRVTADYETCIKRIRARRHAASKLKAKHNDINRILYMQNKENDYEADEFAATFINLPEEEYREYYDIFADFRFGGYKLLPDIITETRNYNISANASAMQYPNDSE